MAYLAELQGNTVSVIEKHYSHIREHGAQLRQTLLAFRQGVQAPGESHRRIQEEDAPALLDAELARNRRLVDGVHSRWHRSRTARANPQVAPPGGARCGTVIR